MLWGEALTRVLHLFGYSIAFRKGSPLVLAWLLGSSPKFEAFVGLQVSVAAIKDWWIDVSPNQQGRPE